MTVTVQSFRKDFQQEFGNSANFPDSMISYWLAIASLMLGLPQSPSVPSVASFTGAITGSVLTVSALGFGSVLPFPLLLEGENVPAGIVITGQISGLAGSLGTYQLNEALTTPVPAQAMVALQSGTTIAGNSYWGNPAVTANSPPTTLADFAVELFVAHNIVLEKQAAAAAAIGGDPGVNVGIINNKSVGGVSVGYDVSSVVEDKGGYWNKTIYGMRFLRLARFKGSGPVQIGIGYNPSPFAWGGFGYVGGLAWGGPWPGIAPSDTGFG